MVVRLLRWITERRPRGAAVEAEARRLIERHGPNAAIVARALAGGPGSRHTGFGARVEKRVAQLARQDSASRR